MTTESRRVQQVLSAEEAFEGQNRIRRAFPARGETELDPFLLLDEFGPAEHRPGQAGGFPDHPHRGFQTVTYLLAGEIEHRDSTGGRGLIREGGVQWMNAGSGIVHSELPSERIRHSGGRIHGVQLWVNLRAQDKHTPPSYRDLGPEEIPTAKLADGSSIRVIAGEAAGLRGGVGARTPISYLHLSLAAQGQLAQPVPDGHTALVYVLTGELEAAGSTASASQLIVFEPAGGPLVLTSTAGAEALLLSGEPLREPVARYGPFVMNTVEEIAQAFEDFRAGRMGQIAPA